ncbi:MAG TPA: hypothetical protein VMS64_38335 [Candidatus Methylomirabilis sp.]|nr:hypothetical protein [Candidatus Methylomirabilis sp.]
MTVVKKRLGLDLQGLALRLLFGRWRRPPCLEEGYSILLPMPMDMAFLLRHALDGLRRLDTTHCKQIVVIPDSWGNDGGRGLRRVVESADDSRVHLVELRPAARVLIHRLAKSVGAAANISHWAMIVEGIDATHCEHAFLHDADAFFLDVDGLERQYRECCERTMDTLGVQARWDPFFEEIGYTIPGTWELMFSTRWARRRDPTTLKGRWRSSPHGVYEFDTMLYPQYLDFPTGRIGVIDPPPRFVHFASAVTTYRIFRYAPRPSVVDEMFRLLSLALLEELLPGADRALPTVAELARGLTDSTAPVTYDSRVALEQYPTFRRSIDHLCQVPIFQGACAQRIRELIRPFDEHFHGRTSTGAAPGESGTPSPRRIRRHGLA